MSVNFRVIYQKFIDDARVLPFDETFMNDIEKSFKIKLSENVKNIYNNSPAYYTRITQSNEIFEIYILWFLSIFIIDFSEESSLSKYKTKNDILNWVTPRKDPNIKFFLIGPKQNQNVKNDFIAHYRNLMNAQNTISDISQYLELSSLQNLNVVVSDFRTDMLQKPNSYDKLPNSERAFTVNIDSKFVDIKILNQRTVMDCNGLDFNDVSETTSLSKFNSLRVVQNKSNQISRITIKKLESLLNSYGRIKINSFTIDHNVFDAAVQNFDSAYIIFDGVYVNERNIYSDSSNECLRILGTFSFNQEKNLYIFEPANEFITFRTNESIVRKFNIFVEFTNVGNINKVFNLDLNYSDFINIFVSQSSSSENSSGSSLTNSQRNLILKNSTEISQTNSQKNLKLISKDFQTKLKQNDSSETEEGSKIEYDKISIDYDFFTVTEVKPFNVFIVDDRYYISHANDFTVHFNEYYFVNLDNGSIVSKLFDDISQNDRLLIVPDIIYYDKQITIHDDINLQYFSYHDSTDKFCVTLTIDLSNLWKSLYIVITDDFDMYYGHQTFDEIFIEVSYNVIKVNNVIVSTSNQQISQFNLHFVRISETEIRGFHTDASTNFRQFLKITKESTKSFSIVQNVFEPFQSSLEETEKDLKNNQENSQKTETESLERNETQKTEKDEKPLIDFRDSSGDSGTKVVIDVTNIKLSEDNHTIYSIFEKDGTDCATGFWFFHKTRSYFTSLTSNGFRLLNKISYKNIHKSLMFMDLSKQYLNVSGVIWNDIVFSTPESASGILLDNEFVKCNKFYLQGTTLILLIDNNENKYTKYFDVTGKTFTVFPRIEFTTINPSEITDIIGFFEQTETGTYRFLGRDESMFSDVIGYFYLSQYDHSVLICAINMISIGVLVLRDDGDYDLYDFYLYDIIKNTFFTYDNTNIFKIYDFHNFYTKFFDMTIYKFFSYPTPILTLEGDVLKNYFEMNLENYSRFSIPDNKPLLNLSYSLKNLMEFNPKYNNYPVIKTSEKMITNKKYKLTVDGTEFEGFVVRNGDYYSFCCDDEIILNTNAKINLKINDTLMTCSFQLD